MIHIKTAIITALFLGIALVTEGSLGFLQADLSGGGALLLPPVQQRVVVLSQGPMHAAAPALNTIGSSHITLLLGMILILAGFILSYMLVRSERPVHITIKKSTRKRDTLALRKKVVAEQWFWVKLDI